VKEKSIGGLMVLTFLTLIYVPVFYELFDTLKHRAVALVGRAHPKGGSK